MELRLYGRPRAPCGAEFERRSDLRNRITKMRPQVCTDGWSGINGWEVCKPGKQDICLQIAEAYTMKQLLPIVRSQEIISMWISIFNPILSSRRQTLDTFKRAEELAQVRGLTLSKLSRMCGMNRSTLTSARRRGNQLSVDTIERICEALQITTAEFFRTEPDAAESLTADDVRILHRMIREYKETGRTSRGS